MLHVSQFCIFVEWQEFHLHQYEDPSVRLSDISVSAQKVSHYFVQDFVYSI